MVKGLPPKAVKDYARSLFYRCLGRASQFLLLSLHAGSPMLYRASAFPSLVDLLDSSDCVNLRSLVLVKPHNYDCSRDEQQECRAPIWHFPYFEEVALARFGPDQDPSCTDDLAHLPGQLPPRIPRLYNEEKQNRLQIMDPDIPEVEDDDRDEETGPVDRGDSELEIDAEFEAFDVDHDDLTTTSEQVLVEGLDPQNIPWDRLQVSRQRYRETRLEQYHNYVNLREVVDQNQDRLNKEKTEVAKDGRYYGFHQNLQSIRSDIAHFQLRHLLWTTSKHDVYTTNENCINHYSTVARTATKVLDLSGTSTDSRTPGFGRVQISTFCVRHDLVAVGGFAGELIIANIKKKGLLCSKRVTTSEMGITNGIDIFHGHSGGTSIMTANNDNVVRVFDAEKFRCQSEHKFEWPVNLAVANPSEGSPLAIVVGDDPEAVVLDMRTKASVMHLKGHLDYSFAASWHPDEAHTVATGNQDTSTRIWDLRRLDASKAVMCGNMGAVRSLRYSPDGKFLAAAEPADFVRLYDVQSNYTRCQEIDLFGEIGGCFFTPDGYAFFLCVADVVYSSLMEYTVSKL